MNLEVNTGKSVNTKENLNITCRINSSQEHTWHTSHGQINLIVDLIHNFYISWCKRQDDLELKFEIPKVLTCCSALAPTVVSEPG